MEVNGDVAVIGKIAEAKSLGETRHEAGEEKIPENNVAEDMATIPARVEKGEEVGPVEPRSETSKHSRCLDRSNKMRI